MELEDRPPTLTEDLSSMEVRVRSCRYDAIALANRARAASMPDAISAAAIIVSDQLLAVSRRLDDLGGLLADESAKRFVAALPEHAKTGGAQ